MDDSQQVAVYTHYPFDFDMMKVIISFPLWFCTHSLYSAQWSLSVVLTPKKHAGLPLLHATPLQTTAMVLKLPPLLLWLPNPVHSPQALFIQHLRSQIPHLPS